MTAAHTSRDFEAELRELRGNLIAMGARCERALQLAVTAFLGRDVEGAAEVVALDARIDRDEMEIDELALRILALRQPVAYDLRFLATTLKFVTDLERIGDKAAAIAKRAREFARAPLVPPHAEVAPMSQAAEGMLREAMDAFVQGDADEAERVLARAGEVDERFRAMSRAVTAWMTEHPGEISVGLVVLSVARQLKRVADHATNLAEQVVFMVRGDDVRHRPRNSAPGESQERASK